MTRWLVRHRRLALIAWVLLAAGLLVISLAAGKRAVSSFTLKGTDSGRAVELLEQRFPAQAGDIDQVVFQTHGGSLNDPAMRAVIEATLAKIKPLPHVSAVVSPYAAGAGAISHSGTTGFATVVFDAPPDKVPNSAVDAVIAAANQAGSSTLQVELGGRAIEHAQSLSASLSSVVGLVAAVLVLLISFGSVLAMGLPILTAILGLGAGVAVIGLTSKVVVMADFSTELALMIGLGVGIDYALFIVTRFRDAFADNGGQVEPAIEVAMATAGRAALLAGNTVVVALLALVALGMQTLTGAAIASAIGVVLVLFASLTLLPVLLAFTGRRVGQTRRRRRERTRRPRMMWHRWVGLVQRRPWTAAVSSTLMLLLLSAPIVGLRLANSDAGSDAPKTTTRQAYDLLAAGFGAGFNGPLIVAVALPSANGSAVAAQLADALAEVPGVASVATPTLNASRDTAAITVYPEAAPQSEATERLLKHLRADVVPPLTAATGTIAYIGGITPTDVDLGHQISSKLPGLVGIIVVLSALLLLVAFRSLVVPLQAAVMNLLSIGAALGTVTAVFQHGWLASWIGVEPGPISPFIPVMLFAIVFGLSMDYEVFLISRIREEYQRSGDPSTSVRDGVASTARVITAAAAVMIAVFGAFATNTNLIIKVFGFAMAIAIFVDAIVIRSILLPAVLELTGRWTWWLPARLARVLPTLAVEGASDGNADDTRDELEPVGSP